MNAACLKKSLLVSSIAVAALSFAAAVRADLIGHWKFDTNFNDFSTNANHGTPVGGAPIVAASQFGGGALSLSGSGQYVSVPDIAAYTAFETGSKTISAWVRPVSISGRHYIFSTNTATPSGNASMSGSFALEFGDAAAGAANGGRIAALTPGVFNAITSPSPGPMLVGEWQHILYTRTGNLTGSGHQRIYRNGVLQPLGTDSALATADNSDQKFIGGRSPSLTFLAGGLDDVGIFERSLTPGEARAVYTLGLQQGQNSSQFGFNYDLGTAELLFQLHASSSSAPLAIGDDRWRYFSGLNATGFANGDLITLGDSTFLILAGGGTSNASGVELFQAVPEPGTVTLILLEGIALLNRRRSRSSRR